MGKRITFIFLILSAISTQAQWSVGGRAGFNMCKITGTLNSNYDTRNFWIFGPAGYGMGNYQLNDIFSIRGELGYTIIGTEAIHIYSEGNYSYSYGIMERYNCAQIIFAGQATYNTRILSGYLFIGPYLTHRFGGRGLFYDVKTTEELDIVWVEGYSNYIYDGKLEIGELNNRRYDFGLYAGAGIGKELGKGRIDLGFSFGAGLVDLHKFVEHDYRKSARQNGYKSYHNLNLNVTLSYWFHIRKEVE